jgi:CRISPR system Cascade subunit CasE
MTHPVYLSRLELNPRHHGAARLIGNPHYMHGAVNEAMGVSRVGAPRWLYHLDQTRQETVLTVQSPVVPDWGHLSPSIAPREESKEATSYIEAINTGDLFNFALSAAPRRRNRDTHRETDLATDHERLAWLDRALSSGAEIQYSRIQSIVRISTHNPKPVQMTSVGYIGTLKVTHPIAFRTLVTQGVGPGKGYGQGLLRTERIRPRQP